MARFRIKLHRNGCISSGACVAEAPHLFTQDESGIVTVRKIELSDLEYGAAVAAAEACPAAVIELEEISE
jgi:ferredoxin